MRLQQGNFHIGARTSANGARAGLGGGGMIPVQSQITSLVFGDLSARLNVAQSLFFAQFTITSPWKRKHAPKFGNVHGERDASREDDDPYGDEDPVESLEELGREDREPAFDEDGAEGEADAHDRGEPEEGRERVVHPHRLSVEQDLGERPAQSGQAGCGEHLRHPDHVELRLGRHHHHHPCRDDRDDPDERQRRSLELEEKGEQKDKPEHRRLAHCWWRGSDGEEMAQ